MIELIHERSIFKCEFYSWVRISYGKRHLCASDSRDFLSLGSTSPYGFQSIVKASSSDLRGGSRTFALLNTSFSKNFTSSIEYNRYPVTFKNCSIRFTRNSWFVYGRKNVSLYRAIPFSLRLTTPVVSSSNCNP